MEENDEGEEGEEEEEGGEETDIKSNNPHLTGGEKVGDTKKWPMNLDTVRKASSKKKNAMKTLIQRSSIIAGIWR